MSDTAGHYDRVTDAWSMLLGQNLHYGLFRAETDTLEQATDALTQAMLGNAALRTGQRVLDIGCGTGAPACRIARDHNATVIGISPSQACIDRARDRARTRPQGGSVTFQLGDGMALEFEDGSFDCAWVMESSHLMPDKPTLLRECARVLRPGGQLVLCDVIAQRTLTMKDVISWRDEFLLLQSAFGRAKMEPLSYYQFEMRKAGFHELLIRDVSAETRPTFAHWRDNTERHKQAVAALIGANGWRDFTDSCAVLEKLWDAGILGYGLLAATKPRGNAQLS